MASVVQGHSSHSRKIRPSKIPVRKKPKKKVVFSSGESCDEDQAHIRTAVSRYRKLSTYDCLSDFDDISPRPTTNSFDGQEFLLQKTLNNVADTSSSFNEARCDVREGRKTISLPRLSIQEPSSDRSLREVLIRHYPSDSDITTTPSPYNDACSRNNLPIGYNGSKALLAKRFQQLNHMIQVSNGNETKREASSGHGSNSGQSYSGRSREGRSLISGTRVSGTRGMAAGGSGDDPDDPKKPHPRTEPQDKMDGDVKKDLKEQEEMLAKLLKSIKVPYSDQSNNKQTQTSEEGNVVTLHKKLKLKDKEISAMQNLINCCRNDYEELQQSFDMYKKEFDEVDKNRAYIHSLTKENAALRQENSNKDRAISKLEELNRKLKNKLSKVSIDCDFLRSEKLELLKQLRHYEQNYDEPSTSRKTNEQNENAILALRKSSSLQEVKILKAQEANNLLNMKIEHLQSIIEKLNNERQSQEQREEELKKNLVKLSAENTKLSLKLKEACDFTSKIKNDLQQIYDDIMDGRKRLDDGSIEMRATSSPLSMELADVQNIIYDDEFKMQQSQASMLARSITAAMEELKQSITNTRRKLDKISSNNDIMQEKTNTIFELSQRLSKLQEKFEDEEAKCQAVEITLTDKQTENKQLYQTIEQQNDQLSHAYEDYRLMMSSKDKQISNLQSELNTALAKQGEVYGEYQSVYQSNQELQSTLSSVKSESDKQAENEKELRGYIDELETETQRILGNLTRERRKSQEIQRNFEKAQTMLTGDPTQMQEDLQSKIGELGKLLENIDQSTSSNLDLWCHPYTVAMEKGMQILYEVTGLVNAIGQKPTETTSTSETTETRQNELEAMIEFLEDKNKQLQNEKSKLEKKMKKNAKVTFSEDTKCGEDSNTGDQRTYVKSLQDKLKEREYQLDELTRQNDMVQLENNTIEDLLLEAKQEAVKERDKYQSEIKQLQQKILQNKESGNVQIKKLEEINKELLHKIELYDNLFQKGNEMKEQEQSTDVKVSVSQLQNAIKFLEKRILRLQDEKQDSERQMNTMFKRLNTETELTNCKNERDQLDLEYQKKKQSKKPDSTLQEIVANAERRSRELEDCLAERTALQEELTRWNLTKYSSQETIPGTSKFSAEDKESKENEFFERNAEIDTQGKITSLEAQLKCRTDSEQELCNKMSSLEQRISVLEAEKLHHSRTITSMIRTLQAKDDLAKAIKARDDTEKDFNKQLDDMEVIVTNLKNEKQKAQSDEDLKAKYKKEYYESREKVRKLNATLQKRNQLVEEMRGYIKELRKEEEKLEAMDFHDLKTHFDVLRTTLEDKDTTEQKLKKKLKSLKETISNLQAEKCESDRMVESLLKSVEQNNSRDVENLTEQLKVMSDKMSQLQKEKQNLEYELQFSKKIIEQARGEIKLQEKSSQENIESLEKSLKARHNEKHELKQMLKTLNDKVVQMEADKSQNEKSMKILLNSLKCKDDLENSLKEKQITENALNDKLSQLQLQKDETLKELQQQIKDLKATEDSANEKIAHMETELQELAAQKLSLEGEVNCLSKKLSEAEEGKKASISESKSLAESLFNELNKKTCKVQNLENQVSELQTITTNLKETLTLKEEEWSKSLQGTKDQLGKKTNDLRKTIVELNEALEQNDNKNQNLWTKLQESKDKVSELTQETCLLWKHNGQLQEENDELQDYISQLELSRKNDQTDLSNRIHELVAESKIDNEKIEALERDIMLKTETQNRMATEIQYIKSEIFHEKTNKAEVLGILEYTKQRVEDLERENMKLRERSNDIYKKSGIDDVEKRAKEVILESLGDSEKTIGRIRSNWQYIENLKSKGFYHTQKDCKTQTESMMEGTSDSNTDRWVSSTLPKSSLQSLHQPANTSFI